MISLIATGVSIHYLGERNFNKYLQKIEMNELSSMAQNLEQFYNVNNGFGSIIDGSVPLHFAVLIGGTKIPKGMRFDTLLGNQAEEFVEDLGKRPPEPKDFMTVYDADKNYLIGAKHEINDMHLFPMSFSDGHQYFFGVLKYKKNDDPFEESFMQGQIFGVLATISIVMLLSLVTAIWLTKKMLAPIKELDVATKKIANRDFNIDIKTNAKDELADLGSSFVVMSNTLKEYEQKQSRWISDISHELRTPLSVILGSIEAFQDGVRVPNEETLDALYHNAVRMKKLVNELHDITLAESGIMHFQKVPVDIMQELGGMLDFYGVRFTEVNFRVEVTNDDVPKLVEVDLLRINQVFINILENTVKYAKKPGVLYIDSYIEGDNVVVSFEDTGPGVSEEHLPKLFDRLYRVESSRNRTTGGSGLGLSICKSIIDTHGGEISAETGSKGGLKIIIKLPLEKSDEQ